MQIFGMTTNLLKKFFKNGLSVNGLSNRGKTFMKNVKTAALSWS